MRLILYAPLAQLVEQLTPNLPLGALYYGKHACCLDCEFHLLAWQYTTCGGMQGSRVRALGVLPCKTRWHKAFSRCLCTYPRSLRR